MKSLKLAFAAALLAGAAGGGAVPLAAQSQGMGATGCVSIDGDYLSNGCGYAIEVAWCVDGGSYGYECNGSYRGQQNIGAYGRYAHFGGTNYIRYAACEGSNSISGYEGYSVYCE